MKKFLLSVVLFGVARAESLPLDPALFEDKVAQEIIAHMSSSLLPMNCPPAFVVLTATQTIGLDNQLLQRTTDHSMSECLRTDLESEFLYFKIIAFRIKTSGNGEQFTDLNLDATYPLDYVPSQAAITAFFDKVLATAQKTFAQNMTEVGERSTHVQGNRGQVSQWLKTPGHPAVYLDLRVSFEPDEREPRRSRIKIVLHWDA